MYQIIKENRTAIIFHNIENVFAAFKYNAEKEQKNEWEAKQKELARIEEAKKAEEEKGISY